MTTAWQRAVYANFDAFLAMVRSVPEIIHACFGADDGNKKMKTWFAALSPAERQRRDQFTKHYEAIHERFRGLALSDIRNVVFHRTGVAPVEVSIKGRFGVTHTGSPVARVPVAETRESSDDNVYASHSPVAVQPAWSDFKIGGNLLFQECKAYIDECKNLAASARSIAAQVHGSDQLTPPPS